MPRLVMPGETLATEEEYVPSEGTFVEEGSIRASLIGNAVTDSSKMTVEGFGKPAKPFKSGMAILGLVTDDMRSVVFVRIDSFEDDAARYVALKDGKVIMPKPAPRRGGMHGRHGREEEPQEGQGEQEEEQPAELPQEASRSMKVSDIVLARIISEDKDVYTLSINMPEFGVVHSACELCGGEFEHDREKGALTCKACDRTVYKKLSTLYGDLQGVNVTLKKYAKL